MKLKNYGILSVVFAATLAAAPAFAQEKGKGFANRGHDGKPTAIGNESKQGKERVAGKTTGNEMEKTVRRKRDRTREHADGKNVHASSSSHGRSAGQLPPGLEKYEEKHGGSLPPGLEKQLNEKGHLPPGLVKGGRR
jgi:uncharacterized protein with WD repeat